MARFFIFLFLLVPLVALGNWLLAHPGTVQLYWLDHEITLPVTVATIGVLLACFISSIFLAFLWQLANWPVRYRARKKFRTLTKGLDEITHAVTALALGDEASATRALKKASHALPNEPLPQLLQAQLLQRQGKHEEARQELRALMKHEATSILAARRLIEQHCEERAFGQALALAETLRKEIPEDRWLTLTLIDLYSRHGDTANMLALTEGWKFRSPLQREERHRYAARAYYRMSEQETSTKARLTALRHAASYAPDFIPATLAYANAMLAEGDTRQARKLLRERWLLAPDPLLIAPILASIADTAPEKQPRLLQAFIPKQPTLLAYQLQATHALSMNDMAAAKDALERAMALEETQPLLVLMAEVQQRLHAEETANRLLARAMDAAHGHAWVCQACGHISPYWESHCTRCDVFDSLKHERPETRITRIDPAI